MVEYRLPTFTDVLVFEIVYEDPCGWEWDMNAMIDL